MYETICINKAKAEERTIFERFLDLYLENPEIINKNDNYKNLDWSQYLRQILRDIQNRVYLPQLK